MRCLLYTFFCFFLTASFAFGDLLYLRDGRVLKGEVYQEGNYYYIKMKYGTLQFSKSQVIKVAKDSGSSNNNGTTQPTIKKKTRLLKITQRLLSFGLGIKDVPRNWRLNENPPHPLEGATFNKEGARFAITGKIDTLLPELKKNPSIDNVRSVLSSDLSERYQKVLSCDIEWTTFEKFKALYIQAKVQPYFNTPRSPGIFLQELRCFTPKFEYIFYLEIPLENVQDTAEAKSEFQSLLGRVVFLPPQTYENQIYTSYRQGFQILIPPKWMREKKPAQGALELEGLEEQHILIEKLALPGDTSFYYLKKEVQRYLKKQFSDYIGGTSRRKGSRYLFPGKVWQKNKLYSIECYLQVGKKDLYRLTLLYPSALKKSSLQEAQDMIESFQSVPVQSLEDFFKKNTPAIFQLLEARKHYLKRAKAQSLVEVEKALQVYPNYLEALVLKARIHMEQKEVDLAFSTLQKAYQLDSFRSDLKALYTDFLHKKGTALFAEKKFPEALEYFEKALEADQANKTILRKVEECHANIARGFYQEAKYPQCVRYLEDITKKMSESTYLKTITVQLFSMIIQQHLQHREYSKAERYVKKILKMYPHYKPAQMVAIHMYMNYAQYLWSQEKNKSRAAYYTRKILRIDPRHSQAQNMLKMLQKP